MTVEGGESSKRKSFAIVLPCKGVVFVMGESTAAVVAVPAVMVAVGRSTEIGLAGVICC